MPLSALAWRIPPGQRALKGLVQQDPGQERTYSQQLSHVPFSYIWVGRPACPRLSWASKQSHRLLGMGRAATCVTAPISTLKWDPASSYAQEETQGNFPIPHTPGMEITSASVNEWGNRLGVAPGQSSDSPAATGS